MYHSYPAITDISDVILFHHDTHVIVCTNTYLAYDSMSIISYNSIINSSFQVLIRLTMIKPLLF